MNEPKISYIQRKMLHPHPENPRKDLGDLEELRESIRENGIMQNLTVVPDSDGDGYMILIGHRRFAASEGILDELPCIIADHLTQREQVGIMLAENMQRSDLTFIEQAHGFQLMMDLGDTVESISKKTGFSEATVKHRLEIAKLKKKSIDAALECFQPTIGDYIELERIKDLKIRDEILETSESSIELRDSVQAYIDEQNRKKNSKKYRELIESLGWKETKEYIYSYSTEKWSAPNGLEKIDLEEEYDDSNIQAFAQRNTKPIFFNIDNYFITFGIKNAKKGEKEGKKKKTKEELLREAREKNSRILDDTRTVICDRYLDFIKGIEKKKLEDLSEKTRIKFMERLFDTLTDLECNLSKFKTTYNIKTKKDVKDLEKEFRKMDALQQFMIQVWVSLASSYSNKFVDYNFDKRPEVLKAHQQLYSTLYFFGFRLTDEYKAIIEGTSELYLIDGKEATR